MCKAQRGRRDSGSVYGGQQRHAQPSPGRQERTTIDTRSESDAIARYRQRRDAFEADRLAVHRRWNIVANIRLAAFAGLALATWWALRDAQPGRYALAAGLLALVVVLVAWHARLRRQRDRLAGLVAVNDLALARLDLAWDRLPVPPGAQAPRTHPYAWDLDVEGDASLLRRISTPTLAAGWGTLRDWLLAPAGTDVIADRQAAVGDLAPNIEVRQQVEAAGRRLEEDAGDPGPFLAWAEASPWLLRRPWLWMLAIASPIALVILGIAWLAGAIDGPWWLAPVTLNVVLLQLPGRGVADEVDRATPLHREIGGYAEVFRLIGEANVTAPLLRGIRERLGHGGHGATRAVGTFARISAFVIPRGSLVWLPAQMALLWDVHVLHALERWRLRAGPHARSWFASAGEWEALAALAVLAHDHPGWSFPQVDPTLDAIRARNLTHPLIHHGEAIANDVEVGPSGSFLFVTGSNMSGKSTLLRAIGLNAVLAQAGGPVAARTLAMPPVAVWTCMRVEDSLARGVSFFMAELHRLKAVVDAASAATGTPVLYLLDEILQGTNTAERQIASRQVLDQLTRCHAIGAVSSHDLGLVDGSSLESRVEAVHFAETFTRGRDGPHMSFDYRLRPGIATSTNALALMELLGFDIATSRE